MTPDARQRGARRRLLLFGDSRQPATRIVLGPFAAAARAHPAIEPIGICDTARAPASAARRTLRRAVLQIFDSGNPELGVGTESLAAIARRHGLPVLVPERRDVNDADFVRELRDRWSPDVALSLICLQVFRSPLLACFRCAVNLHNGLLPDYRGLRATAWSLYNGEEVTGYSFHHMTRDIDAGSVLLDGSLRVTPDATAAALDLDKYRAAAERAPELVAMLAAGEPGRPQAAGGGTFTHRDAERIRCIADPEALTAAELAKRLRCFGRLRLRAAGRWWDVTQLAPTGRPRFRTADGRTLGIRRAEFLPPRIYRAYRALASAGAGG